MVRLQKQQQHKVRRWIPRGVFQELVTEIAHAMRWLPRTHPVELVYKRSRLICDKSSSRNYAH